MATKFRMRNTATFIDAPVPVGTYKDIVTEPFVAGASNLVLSTATDANGERQWGNIPTNPFTFYSERIETEVTISGTITFVFWTTCPVGFTARLRARLWKVVSGGSNIESLLCVADASADMVGTGLTKYTFTATPTSTTLGPGERFVVRWYATPVAGSFGTPDPTGQYNEETDASAGSTWFEVTETVTVRPNQVKIHLRRTSANGIGTFVDALETVGGSAFTTGVVATQDGATEIQWTGTPALTITEIAAAVIASTTNATTYASASYTPVANRLYLLAVVHSDAAPEATVPTVATTTGLTFVQVGSSLPFGSIASNVQRLTLFRAMKASGLAAGTHTVTLADAATGCAAVLAEVIGAVTTGTDGADAVINASTNSADASANPSVTLGTFTSTNNGAFACFGAATQTAPTIGSGWTGLSNPDYATPATGLFAEWRATNDTSADCVLASGAWAGIAVELVAGDATALEWITPRMKAPGWDFPLATWVFAGQIYCYESDLLANCGLRLKLFRRSPDGTELLVYTKSSASEFATTVGGTVPTSGTLAQSTLFSEDDRLVIRAYIIPVGGTMVGGHTCTINYDHNVLGVSGDCWIHLQSAPAFKVEGDLVGPGPTPSGMMLRGVGN